MGPGGLLVFLWWPHDDTTHVSLSCGWPFPSESDPLNPPRRPLLTFPRLVEVPWLGFLGHLYGPLTVFPGPFPEKTLPITLFTVTLLYLSIAFLLPRLIARSFVEWFVHLPGNRYIP